MIASGANLGFIDPAAHIARWKDEVTEALFWVCDNAGNVPQYTQTYVDRYLGMGNVADYLNAPAQPAAQDDFTAADDTDEFPFN